MEKLPFTISKLVSCSPLRSSDGMIYTSKKVDEWNVIDLSSGQKLEKISSESPICPTDKTAEATTKGDSNKLPNFDSASYPSALLHLFKATYEVSVFESNTREKMLNFTYTDYTSSIFSSIEQQNYNFMHLTSSTTGHLFTIDVTNNNKQILWSHQFRSPVVGMFVVSDVQLPHPLLHRIPFITLGGRINTTSFFERNSLYPSVFIGELDSRGALYALSTLVDFNNSRKETFNLIGGAVDTDSEHESDYYKAIGYYQFPEKTRVQFTGIADNEMLGKGQPGFPLQLEGRQGASNIHLPMLEGDMVPEYVQFLFNLLYCVIGLVSALLVALVVFAYFHFIKKSVNPVKVASTSSSYNSQIGKISYNSTDIIGRGCAGTCVYRGLFEDRQHVAVKRIVADCFQLANREIELLRKLEHPNLIRYFATEKDTQFLYIAIELAELTLAEYIERKQQQHENLLDYDFNKPDILHQACLGLAHLHSLSIVHRDIKPANILISMPISPNNKRKVMISDFGVSKILSSDTLTTELSAGTEGWIAPEILKARPLSIRIKASKPNDIFSLGCVIYYTYTDGDHPFGNGLHRQTNILKGEHNLEAIQNEEDMTIHSLVEPMIACDPADRPPIEVLLKHPYFWTSKQQLQFLQDVSDRIECEPVDSPISELLEKGSIDVCRGDWRRHLSQELQEDLRKFRFYKGTSVKELLRAIRNKRHHYHELDPKLQESLGSIPDEFVNYFTSKFPRLIMHSYIAMQICSKESLFQHYYHLGSQAQEAFYAGDQKASDVDFKFPTLPRSEIRWFERIKEMDKDPITSSPFIARQRTNGKSKTKKASTGNNKIEEFEKVNEENKLNKKITFHQNLLDEINGIE